MLSVFNANLQTDIGKTIARRHLTTTDAQAVWRELNEHMRISSKGASEKRRLTQYVLDDNFKGTTEQFVLHYNEQFRQLDEISDDREKLPPTVKLTLLQTAVRSINDPRIVETLDEFQSTTHGHGSSTYLSYQTYYDLLINACVRYDRYPPPPRPGNPSQPPFRPHSQQSGPQKSFKRYDGPIYLPPLIFRLLNQDVMKALKAYNTEAINRFHQKKVHNTKVVELPQDAPPDPSGPDSDLPESVLAIPDGPILDFVNSQCCSSEDLDQALQAYQAYQIPCPQDSTTIPERNVNHHDTHHVAQASQFIGR